ncbi:hypothetical protein MLD38_017513 [Melastoma candidum]|uniref:Uncharacterized protein n=1 Tax=Melastoma candidum TaxID=119954 RepID=A0ACB9QRE1_9MYRT|nr:hypothetical protein MLD38_017513 [Melastoma candidum]
MLWNPPAGWGPHAYFEMLAESREGPQAPSSSANRLNIQGEALQDMYIDPERGPEMSRTTSRDSIPMLAEPRSSNWRH